MHTVSQRHYPPVVFADRAQRITASGIKLAPCEPFNSGLQKQFILLRKNVNDFCSIFFFI